MKVVILAGGLGTRLSEYTKSIPKPMVSVGGKPIIHHILSIFLAIAAIMTSMCKQIKTNHTMTMHMIPNAQKIETPQAKRL